MNSRGRLIIHCAVWVMFGLTFVTAAGLPMAQADSGGAVYRVLPIPTPAGWQNVIPSDINRSGQIVGYGFNGTTYQPFIADVRTATPIALSGIFFGAPYRFVDAFGLAINASGQIVGWGEYEAPPPPPFTAIFKGGISETTLIPTATHFYAYGYDINDSGRIVGTYQGSFSVSCRPFFAYGGGGSLPPIGNLTFIAEAAFSINNIGQVAGVGLYRDFSRPGICPVAAIPPQIFMDDSTGTTAVPVPNGWIPSFFPLGGDSPMQINDLGQIVTAIVPADGSNVTRVALSTKTSTFLIPLPPGVLSAVRPRLNNLSQVVGVGGNGGWIWDASHGTRLLQDLVPSGWTILSADGINDNGQIVARASNSQGFSGPVILDPAVNVNSLVTFTPMAASYRTLSDTTGCPAGFVGKFTFTASLTNKSTSPALQGLAVQVQTLSNGNLLLNPQTNALIGGQGAILSAPKQGMNADDVLSPGEAVDVPFVMCLKTRQSFQFFVDVFGVPDIAP